MFYPQLKIFTNVEISSWFKFKWIAKGTNYATKWQVHHPLYQIHHPRYQIHHPKFWLVSNTSNINLCCFMEEHFLSQIHALALVAVKFLQASSQKITNIMQSIATNNVLQLTWNVKTEWKCDHHHFWKGAFCCWQPTHRTHKGTINCTISHSLGGIWRDAKTFDLFPCLLQPLISVKVGNSFALAHNEENTFVWWIQGIPQFWQVNIGVQKSRGEGKDWSKKLSRKTNTIDLSSYIAKPFCTEATNCVYEYGH